MASIVIGYVGCSTSTRSPACTSRLSVRCMACSAPAGHHDLLGHRRQPARGVRRGDPRPQRRDPGRHVAVARQEARQLGQRRDVRRVHLRRRARPPPTRGRRARRPAPAGRPRPAGTARPRARTPAAPSRCRRRGCRARSPPRAAAGTPRSWWSGWRRSPRPAPARTAGRCPPAAARRAPAAAAGRPAPGTRGPWSTGSASRSERGPVGGPNAPIRAMWTACCARHEATVPQLAMYGKATWGAHLGHGLLLRFSVSCSSSPPSRPIYGADSRDLSRRGNRPQFPLSRDEEQLRRPVTAARRAAGGVATGNRTAGDGPRRRATARSRRRARPVPAAWSSSTWASSSSASAWRCSSRRRLGVMPWDVLHQGLARRTGLSLGTMTIIVGALVLLDVDPAARAARPGHGQQRPGDRRRGGRRAGAAARRRTPSAVRVGARRRRHRAQRRRDRHVHRRPLGAGPRDGLMTGLVRRTGASVRLVRTSIEVGVVAAGWLLGGTVGVATVVFALAIGPLVHVFLPRFTVPAPADDGIDDGADAGDGGRRGARRRLSARRPRQEAGRQPQPWRRWL